MGANSSMLRCDDFLCYPERQKIYERGYKKGYVEDTMYKIGDRDKNYGDTKSKLL